MALSRKSTQTEITMVIVGDGPKPTPIEAQEVSSFSGESTAEGGASSASADPSSASKGQAEKQDNNEQPKKDIYSVPVGTGSDLKADMELGTAVKAATVGILSVLSASIIVLLMYLNREYFGSSAPGVGVVGSGANFTAIVVPEIVEHRTPLTWPARKDTAPPHGGHNEWVPTDYYTDIEPDITSPFYGEPIEITAKDYPETETIKIPDKDHTGTEPAVEASELVTNASEETVSETEPTVDQSEPVVSELVPLVNQSEAMISGEIDSTPTAPQTEAAGRLLRDGTAYGDEFPTTTTPNYNASRSDRPASNASIPFSQ
ncbi:hypothetical protein HPB50_003687 [Hyalomma asiaticum]|uniref:Uncharacterized protein n=1 Tax=Hyalomma asiaticum TaxID=266040 RepID=A0ACB7SV98_HYAAI|nr:hypothetical protein HPB50_003687 [Hyalomma asiaticum]